MEQGKVTLPQKKDLKFIILENFSRRELSLIMKAVKQALPEQSKSKALIFAKATEHSRKMTLKELVDDISEDHLYLLENPPPKPKQ